MPTVLFYEEFGYDVKLLDENGVVADARGVTYDIIREMAANYIINPPKEVAPRFGMAGSILLKEDYNGPLEDLSIIISRTEEVDENNSKGVIFTIDNVEIIETASAIDNKPVFIVNDFDKETMEAIRRFEKKEIGRLSNEN